MNMYYCKLVNKQGDIIDSFYREGTSPLSVLHALQLFQWPRGEWIIEEA